MKSNEARRFEKIEEKPVLERRVVVAGAGCLGVMLLLVVVLLLGLHWLTTRGNSNPL